MGRSLALVIAEIESIVSLVIVHLKSVLELLILSFNLPNLFKVSINQN